MKRLITGFFCLAFNGLLALFISLPTLVNAQTVCEALLPASPSPREYLSHQRYVWNTQDIEAAKQIMIEGSLNVSRTKASGRRFLVPESVADSHIAKIAEENFVRAVDYVFANYRTLEIDQKSAIELNRILTERLVPENIRGQYNYRNRGNFVGQMDVFIPVSSDGFYLWLNMPQAKQMQMRDPVAFAEIIHNSLVSLDSFPDGNGRLSRIFSDLVLIKNGLAPAFYTDMQDYFYRGNARSTVPRETRQAYFREIVQRGQAELRSRTSGN